MWMPLILIVQSKRKKVVVINVIPDPVGPIKRTLLFSSSTLSSSSNPSETPESAPDLVLKPPIQSWKIDNVKEHNMRLSF